MMKHNRSSEGSVSESPPPLYKPSAHIVLLEVHYKHPPPVPNNN